MRNDGADSMFATAASAAAGCGVNE